MDKAWSETCWILRFLSRLEGPLGFLIEFLEKTCSQSFDTGQVESLLS